MTLLLPGNTAFLPFNKGNIFTVKPVLSGHSKGRPKLVFKTDYRLMQVKSIAECSKRAFCNTFDPHKLPFVLKTIVLSFRVAA